MSISTSEQLKSATILLAEDDASILEGVADLLEIACQTYDVTVLKAANGREALHLLQDHTPDLIISDLAMPEMDGYELLAAVRKQDEWIHIPFVFLTAKVSKQEVRKGRLTGVELYITKPFDSQELIELVETLLTKTRQQAEQRNKRSSTLKREILRSLQHEFRTPLTYVTAYFEILSSSYDESENPQDLQEYLHGIQSGSRRLMKLAVDLIAALELSTGALADEIKAASRPIEDVGALLRTVVNGRRVDALEQNIELYLEPDAELPTVYGDIGRIQDIFERLIDNSIKFTKVKGEGSVWVSAEIDTSFHIPHLSISFRDNGIGFSNQVRDHLFEMFYQDGRDRWEQQGPGVGLAIVKALVGLHNGTIEANGTPDKGATFTVSLPIYSGDAGFLDSAEYNPQKQATILAVEDDHHLLAGLCELLDLGGEQYTFHVAAARNGVEALAILEDIRPDLILSDINMPLMDGYEFFEQIKANPNWLDIPFIFLSANSERKDVHKGKILGADDYVTKPYDVMELISILESRLDRHFAKQAADSADFSMLKSQILASLELNFIDSLSEVSSHSQTMTNQLAATETADDLISSLQGIQHGSSQLSELVDNFTTLVELRTGAAESAYQLRRQAIGDMGAVLREICRMATNSQAHLPDETVTVPIEMSIPDHLPSFHADPNAIDKIFLRLVQTMVQISAPVDGAAVTVSAESDAQTLKVTVGARQTRISAELLSDIQTFLADPDFTTLELDHYGSAITIIKEYVTLHNGTITLAPNQNGLLATVTMPLMAPPAA